MKTMTLATQLSLLCIFLFVTNTCAQRNDFKPSQQEINRIFFFSSSAPILRAISQVTPSVAQHVQFILSYVEFVEKQILASLAIGTQVKPDKISRLCTSNDPRLNNSIYRSFGLRGIPDPDRACITEVQAEGDSLTEDAPFSVDALYNAINQRGIILNQNMKAIASRFINVQTNFTGAEMPHGFAYNRDSTRCVLHSACGIREGADWRLGTPIHNRFKYESIPDFGRQIINEYSRSANGRLVNPLRMRLQEFRIDDFPREIRGASTSILSESRNAHPGCFLRERISQNPAVLDAIYKVDQSLTHAEDAIKPSAIAILVFPLGFTLVPIALLAEVSKLWLLLYMLISDVLPCIPLLIKGIELLSIERSPQRAFTVRVTAALNGTLSETAAAEIWAAECRAPSEIRNAGIAFLVIAVLFMVGGVVAEVLARKYAKEHKRRSLEAAYSGEGRLWGTWTAQDEAERLKEEKKKSQDKSEGKTGDKTEGKREAKPEDTVVTLW